MTRGHPDPAQPMDRSMERNIALYPWFRVASETMAWIPVFFLYFSRYLPLEQVIQLSSVYYASVFLLEVPSGYFSDRVGRRATLMISAASLVAAHLLFLTGNSLAQFALAQFLLAGGIAFQSGTDTAFHYDSLSALGRGHEFEVREARAERFGLVSIALATLAGGVFGSIDLRLPYAISLAGGIAMLLIVLCLAEPRSHVVTRESFLSTLSSCVRRLDHPVLRWIFCAMVLMYALEHIPFEFYQPYIGLLELGRLDALGNHSPLVSGVVISVSMFGGVIGAACSVRARRLFGLFGLVALAMAIQLAIVSALGMVLSVAMLGMVFIRNFPMAMIHAPVNATIAPLVGDHQRATYLSLQGLAQRIVFAGLLFGVSLSVGDVATISWETLGGIFRLFMLAGAVGLVALLLTRPRGV